MILILNITNQYLAQRFMENDLLLVKAYFEKIERKRLNMFVSEMKKQYTERLKQQGFRSKDIQKVISVTHDQVWHYLNRWKPNPFTEDIVAENLDKWIEQGIYPIVVREYNGNMNMKTSYKLSENPFDPITFKKIN